MKIRHFLVVLTFFILAASSVVSAQKTSADEKRDPKAVKLWDKAIVAKGGRERLDAVRNLYQERIWPKCTNGCIEDYLFVFPDKIWKFDVTPFGFFEPRGDITIWNFEKKLSQKVYRNMQANLEEGRSVPIEFKPRSYNPDYGQLEYPQIILLLESKWLKPIPLSVRKGWVGLRRVDIIRVQIPDVIDLNTKTDLVIDFYLDNNHLPIETRFVINGKTDKESSVTYSNYADVGGIKLPQKHTQWRPLFADPDTKGSEEYKYQINVNVDETIFIRPLNNHMGRYEWRKPK